MNEKNKPIVVEENYNQPSDVVWRAISDLEQMKNWFFKDLESFKPEVGFKTQFNVKVEDRNFLHLWELTEVIPNKKITYNWRYEGYEGNSWVTFDLFEVPAGTHLKLTHVGGESFPQNIEEFSRENGIAGWTYFININLKEYLEKK